MRTFIIKKLFILPVVLLAGIFVASQARAQFVTFEFTATVWSVNNTEILAGGSVSVGDTVTGFYTFDSTSPDLNEPSTQLGFYEFNSAPNGIFARTGDNVFQTDPNNVDMHIALQETTTFTNKDVYFANFDDLLAPLPSGSNPVEIFVNIIGDGQVNILDSDDLPLVPPVLYPGVPHEIGIRDSLSPTAWGIFATLDTLTLAPPPDEKLTGLAAKVMNLNLANGISNSLDAKIDAVMNALDDMNENNDVAACNSLGSFINAVEAQNGDKISEGDAEELIADAKLIQLQLGCN